MQEEDVEPSEGQQNVLNQLRDWELWWVKIMNFVLYWRILYTFAKHESIHQTV